MAIIEIDPYEALVALAAADAGLVAQCGAQIDIWHHYGQDVGDWPLTSKSLVFVPTGGELDADSPFARPSFEVRCYGDSPYDCGQVWRALVAWTVEHNERRTVTVTEGKALVQFVLPLPGEGMPRLLFDEDIRPNGGMPYYSVLMRAEVANQVVT
jgi:hypothetical protein